MFSHFRSEFSGTVMVNVDMTQARGNHLIGSGVADLVAFGQAFISNPDLPQRFADGAALTAPDHTTYYTPGPHGYTDYAMRNVHTSPSRNHVSAQPTAACVVTAAMPLTPSGSTSGSDVHSNGSGVKVTSTSPTVIVT